MRYYELQHEETAEAVEFRNSIFSHVDLDHWHSMRCTGVVARGEAGDADAAGVPEPGRIAGFIPLQFRTQLLRPGVAVPVVYENAVGVDERLRSRGIGSAMIDTAAAFIEERADALFVIRGGETTTGYRFYRKSGHSDLCYAVSAERAFPNGGGDTSGVREVTADEWIGLEAEFHRLHEAYYGAFGGGRLRKPGYWREILAGHVFRTRPWRFLVASMRSSGDRKVNGYAVAVRGTWQHLDDEHIYELVADEETTAARLVAAVANRSGVTVRVPGLSLANPLRPRIRRLGFEESRSEPQIMARIVAPARLFRRLADTTGSLPQWWHTVRIECSTPHRAFVLKEAPDATQTVHLEMKEHTLAKMLCCRLDFAAATADETIRVRGAEEAVIEVLASICRPAPWVQWYADYV